jgi:hypothetical protein
VDISQQTAILIPLLPVIFQAYRLALNHLPGEGRCFLARVFNWLVGMLGCRGIDTDEPDLFTVAQLNGMTINNSGALKRLGRGICKRYEQKQGRKKEEAGFEKNSNLGIGMLFRHH